MKKITELNNNRSDLEKLEELHEMLQQSFLEMKSKIQKTIEKYHHESDNLEMKRIYEWSKK